jgi:hypothetical protein
MTKVPGRLIVDLLPDGAVRIVFLSSNGDRDATPITVTDLDTAEIFSMTCGLSAERAAALRVEMSRNRVAGLDISIDEEIAARFR